MKNQKRFRFTVRGSVLVIVIGVLVIGGSTSWAAQVSGPSCSKAGKISGAMVCQKKNGKLVWVKKPTTAATTTTSTSTTSTTTAKTPSQCATRSTTSGKAAGATQNQPGGTRLRAAVSSNGITWTRLSDPVIDQAATPSMVLSAEGIPLLYLTAHNVNGERDGFAVSVGSADGRTWRHCQVTIKNFPQGSLGVDPDVVALPGGGYRMYLTGTIGSTRILVYYADSSDGITWTYGGVAFEQPTSILDSVTFQIGSSWHMYALDNTSNKMVHGTSSDGRTFTYANTAAITINGFHTVMSQVANIGGQLRMFSFIQPPGASIASMPVTDGATWPTEASNALVLDTTIEYKFIKDPAVVRLADGSYLMVYTTALP